MSRCFIYLILLIDSYKVDLEYDYFVYVEKKFCVYNFKSENKKEYECNVVKD